LFCTEYCGVGHSSMITKVEVMNEKDFDSWYRGKEETGMEITPKPGAIGVIKREESHHPDGSALINAKGCLACHTTDGTSKIGPTFKGVFGRKETVVRDGKEREITVDEAFIKQSILQPEIDRVKGFPPIMPSQKGFLTDVEVDAIIEYLKTLK